MCPGVAEYVASAPYKYEHKNGIRTISRAVCSPARRIPPCNGQTGVMEEAGSQADEREDGRETAGTWKPSKTVGKLPSLVCLLNDIEHGKCRRRTSHANSKAKLLVRIKLTLPPGKLVSCVIYDDLFTSTAHSFQGLALLPR